MCVCVCVKIVCVKCVEVCACDRGQAGGHAYIRACPVCVCVCVCVSSCKRPCRGIIYSSPNLAPSLPLPPLITSHIHITYSHHILCVITSYIHITYCLSSPTTRILLCIFPASRALSAPPPFPATLHSLARGHRGDTGVSRVWV